MSQTNDKSFIMRTFNQQFFLFIDDIIRIFPDHSEIAKARVWFETLKHSNPSILVRFWFSKIYAPYREAIDNNILDFFFEKDYTSDLENASYMVEIMNFIDSFREPVKSMNDINKQHTMKHVKILSQLSLVYNQYI